MSSGGSGRVSGSATPIARPSLHVHHQDNWETIDTLHERDVAATQHIKNVERTIAKGMQLPAFPESQAVLSAILGGTILALVAVWIHAANNFMVSIRLGLCVNAFWLDEETCCPGAEGGCPQFVTCYGNLLTSGAGNGNCRGTCSAGGHHAPGGLYKGIYR